MATNFPYDDFPHNDLPSQDYPYSDFPFAASSTVSQLKKKNRHAPAKNVCNQPLELAIISLIRLPFLLTWVLI